MGREAVFMFPEFRSVNTVGALYVDGKPYLIRGGEIHNSASADAEYMRTHVWPYVRKMNLNTILTPVSWESIEQTEGVFDFSVLDQILAQAAQENMRLILLWFGLWKNAQSTYAPEWIKRDETRYFRSQACFRDGLLRSACSVSPLCDEAVEKDAHAFSTLMNHLKEVDGQRHIVIAVQIENEVGYLGSERDFCPLANQMFEAEVPRVVSEAFRVSGSWQSAFREEACAQFMSWCYANAVGKIAEAGKRAYPLPFYVNAWTIQYPNERPGSYPAGAPVIEYIKMWRLMARDLCWYSPDVYLPDFARECQKYAKQNNTLFIPEAHRTNHAASYALYAAGACHGIGFCAFGIEDMENPNIDQISNGFQQEALGADLKMDNSLAPRFYEATNGILRALWTDIERRRGTTRLQGFLQYDVKKAELVFSEYRMRIRYLHHNNVSPIGGGLVIELTADSFLFVAVNAIIDITPSCGMAQQVEIATLREVICEEERWYPGRVLNGDEQGLIFTHMPKAILVSVRRREIQ